MSDPDPRCPECGEPIGQTATYCMHCSADLTDERAAADAAGDGSRSASGRPPDDSPNAGHESGSSAAAGAGAAADDDKLLADDGLVDNTLTVVVGIAGGLVVGVVGTFVLGVVTASGWALLFGVLAWLGATAHLVRRGTVQAAVSHSGYGVAAVLLLVPLVALSPVVEVGGGLSGRGGLFVVLLAFVAVPAGIAAVVGVVASRFVPDEG